MVENGRPSVLGEYIFVYGTLLKKTGTPMHHFLASHCDFFSDGHIKGRLFMVDGYPGAIESYDSNDRVFGEIYTMSNLDLVLSKLDEYEGCSDNFAQPHEYIRKKLLVNLPDNRQLLAWTYLFNYDVAGLKEITSGNFLNP